MDGSKRTNDIKSLHSQWHHGLTHVNWQTTNNIATWLTNQVNIICKGYRPEARGYVIYSTRALPDGANFFRVGRFNSLWGSANARFRRARSSAITRLKYHQRTWYNALWLWRRLPHKLSKRQSMSTTVLFRNGLGYYIEDITWLCGDKKFLLECWKIYIVYIIYIYI